MKVAVEEIGACKRRLQVEEGAEVEQSRCALPARGYWFPPTFLTGVTIANDAGDLLKVNTEIGYFIDKVWVTDWSTNAIVRFDPVTERFDSFPSSKGQANVRQMLGRSGEAWGAESGNDRLVMVPAP